MPACETESKGKRVKSTSAPPAFNLFGFNCVLSFANGGPIHRYSPQQAAGQLMILRYISYHKLRQIAPPHPAAIARGVKLCSCLHKCEKSLFVYPVDDDGQLSKPGGCVTPFNNIVLDWRHILSCHCSPRCWEY